MVGRTGLRCHHLVHVLHDATICPTMMCWLSHPHRSCSLVSLIGIALIPFTVSQKHKIMGEVRRPRGVTHLSPALVDETRQN